MSTALDRPAYDNDANPYPLQVADEEKRRILQANAMLELRKQQAETAQAREELALSSDRRKEATEQSSQNLTTQTGDISAWVRAPAYRGKSWAEVSAASPEVPQHFGLDTYGAVSAVAPDLWNQAQTRETGVVTGAPIAPPTPAQLAAASKVGIARKENQSGDDLMGEVAQKAAEANQPANYDDATEDEQRKADAIISYRLPPPTTRGGYTPEERKRILSIVTSKDPTYDANEYAKRGEAERKFATGPQGNLVRSANALIGHIDNLSKAAEAMHNHNFTPLNWAGNLVEPLAGDERLNHFNTARETVATELAKFLKGGNASPTTVEIENWKKLISPNMAPKQMQDAVQQYIKLMGSQMNALQDQWENSVKRPRDIPFLNREAAAVVKRLGVDPMELEPGSEAGDQQPERPEAIDQTKGPVLINSKAAYDALPSGAHYIDTQGNEGIKK